MSFFKISYRLFLLVIVTIAFSTTFYISYRNSKATGSPLNDEEYMQELTTLSERYDIVSPPIPSLTPVEPEDTNQQNIIDQISLSVLNFLSNIIK